jgi:hypothetical protein
MIFISQSTAFVQQTSLRESFKLKLFSYKIQNSSIGEEGDGKWSVTWFRVPGLVFGIWGLGFGIWGLGLGFRVSGLGFRV